MQKEPKTKARFKRNVYSLAFQIFGIFGFCAVLGLIIGSFVDDRIIQAPFGTLASLGISYLLGWIGVFAINRKFRKIQNEKDQQ